MLADPTRRVPVSTYRLQLDGRFTFRHAREVVPYLATLGVSACYLSPFLERCSDNSAGYDVADHSRIDRTLGGEAEYVAFSDCLREAGLGQLADVVPNHMGIAGSRNAWWLDVLESGPASPYAPFFDVDWEPLRAEMKNRVLLPILGDLYGRVLESQELVLEFQDGAFLIRYQDAVLPVGPRTYAQILRFRLSELEALLGPRDPYFLELQSIITATSHLPARTETDPQRQAERAREKEIIKRRLDALTRESPAVKAFIGENVRQLSGTRNDPASFDRLDQLLGEQVYRVAYWRVAADEINYRRFFDVNDLAAIRMEEPAVFEATHELILRLIREGRVTGLRIDHPDGLYAPAEYLRNLQQRCARELHGGSADHAVERPFYIVVEKVLMGEEPLPEDWPVDGTTGYEFLNALNGIFVDPAGGRLIDRIYQRFTGATGNFAELVYDTKKLIMDTNISSELQVLGHRLARLAAKHRASRDFTEKGLTDALREVIACFPVYRTYIGDGGGEATDRDRRYVERAVGLAKRRNPTTSGSVFDFIRDVLCLRFPDARGQTDRSEPLAFVMKFQQLTGPITAKGVEDTAFYRYNRLCSLNEVGGSPERFGTSLAEFHARNARRLARWPGSLSATSTHDTKRSEDVRARINVLSEMPEEWRARLRMWHRVNRRHRSTVDGQVVPDRNEEYFLYQTLLGAWPVEPVSDAEYGVFTERIQQYVFKALHEAKVHVSWVNPNPEYDAAIRRFIGAVLDRTSDNPFLADFLPFELRLSRWGMYTSLSQTLLKLAAPGVPDIYQGAELWDLSLVDPDNRRPVDYAARAAALEEIRRALATGPDQRSFARGLTDGLADGRIKLYLIYRGLTARRDDPALFSEGAYVPLPAHGGRRDHVCAFLRRHEARAVVAVAPRFLARLCPDGPPLGKAVWDGTWLTVPDEPIGTLFRNTLTGETVRLLEREGQPALAVEDVLTSFPVALLVADREAGP